MNGSPGNDNPYVTSPLPPEGNPPRFNPSPPPSPPPEKEKKGNKGCLFGMGCLGCGLVGCISVIVITIVLFVLLINFISNDLLSKTPLDMPEVSLTDQQETQLSDKLQEIKNAVDEGRSADISLILTQDEINYQLRKNQMEGEGIYIEILPNNNLAFKVSVPISNTAPTSYWNMEGKGSVSVRNNRFIFDFDQFTVGKTRIPGGDFMKGFSQGMAENLETNPIYLKLPIRVKSLEVKDEALHMEIRVKSQEEREADIQRSMEPATGTTTPPSLDSDSDSDSDADSE